MAQLEDLYLVQRAMFIHGKAVAIGSVLQLTRLEAVPLMVAGKVTLAPDKPAKVARNGRAVLLSTPDNKPH